MGTSRSSFLPCLNRRFAVLRNFRMSRLASSAAPAGSNVGAFQQASRTVPIVFVTAIDPVGGGWVESLSRPGTNATGFASFEFRMSGKWLEPC